MLVLSRHRDETIVIGDDEIRVTIIDIRGDKVRLGIDAARDVPVHRQEVYEAIRKQGRKITSAEKGHDVATLRAALEKSLNLQSYYAELLNMYDGGKRSGFASADAWIARLRQTGDLEPMSPKADS